ncbi:MAG: starch-binding protein [Bacteroidaceae bacterium]|nr:starch-binding protein [Bacteroidaceae bacterium]
MKKLFTLFCLMALATASNATSIVYDFEALLSGGYTTINSSGTKVFEGKTLHVISSFTNVGGDVGVNVNGRIAALYQSGNGSNFWFRDASRPWFVSAGKTSYMAFDDLKAGDVVKIIGALTPLTILCDNVEGYEKGTTFDATYTEDAPLELVAKVDGYIYGSYGGYTAIKKIIVESSAAEAASDPIITITAAKDAVRTVTIDANTGAAGTAQTAYYSLDGSEPTNASTEYTAPFTVSETTTVKAVAYCGETASNVVTLEVEAGFTIKLNDAVLGVNAMQAKESLFSPVYGVSADNSLLIGSPTATLSASFLGKDVTADLLAGTFIPSANGKLIVTSTAEGYESSTVTEVVYSTYNQTYASADYSALTDEASVQNALGAEWSKDAPTRWANWNKNNSIYGDKYNVYSYTGEAEGNIYLDKDNMLRGPKALQFMESFGFGRGVSGATTVSIENTGTPQDITLYRVINSKGLDVNTYTETFVKSTNYNFYNSYSKFDIPGCETLCQVTIYSPEVQSTYTAKFINTKDWEKVYVWVWNEEENLYDVWSGKEITKTGEQIDGHDVYVWTYTGDFIPGYIIFNNGIEQTSDLDFVDGGVYNHTGLITLNTYTATFKTNLVWESVYAYAWSGDGDTAVKFLGDWPGTKVTDVDDSNDDYDIYTLTFEAYVAPEKIIFSNGVGGKVGRTQTADLEFVNGKEYSLIYVPSDLMEYAIQLAASADEGEALDKLLEAIQYAFENDDESQLQAAIDQFIADTEKANYFIEFSAGKYYIIDAETDMKMAAGGSFGTHGIVNELGLDLWLTPYTESRTVTIDSRVSGGGDSHFLSQNLFMDSEEWGWGLLYQGFGFYIKDPNSGKYINIDEDNNLVLSDTPREWIIVTDEGVREERLEELAYATIDKPKDATFLITAPNFNRNDQRNAEAWNVSGDCTLSTGNEVNNCAESLHSTFTISQTLAGAPKGTYQLTAQGFYRQDDGASEAAPQFFIGSEMVQLPKLTGSEANASDASASFTNGLYTIDPITFYYDGTGDLTIGIQGTAEHQWVVFDNFCLTYLSPEEIQGDDPADYELYVAGVQVTSTNAKDILGDGGTFTFKAKTKTLTINGSYTYDDWFLIRNEVEDLTIYVANDVELSAATPDFLFYLWKSTTITGPGKLTLNGNIAVVYGSLLTIKDANIEFPQTTSYAIMGNQEGEKLLINNSSIHAVSYYQAIGNFDGGITIEDSMLEDGLRISDDGSYICKTDGGDANDVTIYNLDYITVLKDLKDFKDSKDLIFNLAGQRLSKPMKGINIIDGKKVLIK